MKKKLKNIFKYALSFLVAAVLLYFCFRNVEWSDFASALSNCRWGFVVLSFATGVLSFWFRGLRWKMLINPIDPSISGMTCFNAVSIGLAANLALPRAGEFVRCGVITNASEKDEYGKKKASYDKVLGTVVLERAWDIVTLLIFLFIVVACTWKKFGSFFQDNVFGQIAAGLSIPWLLLIMVAIFAGFVVLVRHFREKSGVCAKIWKVIAGIWEGIVSCLHMKSGWMFIVLTMGIWLWYWLMAATIVWAVKGIPLEGEAGVALMSMNMVDALFLMVVGAVSSLVPVPGGFGAYHYLLALALQSVYGIPHSVGIVFATLSHETQTLAQIICGLWGWASESLKKR